MNSISLFIYVASVVPSVVHFVGFVCSVAIAVSLITLFFRSLFNNENTNSYTKRYDPEKYELARDYFKNKRWKVHIKHIAWAIVVLFFLQLVPSEKTLYMIAGSELAEAAVTSETGQEILTEVKDTIMFKLNQIQQGE